MASAAEQLAANLNFERLPEGHGASQAHLVHPHGDGRLSPGTYIPIPASTGRLRRRFSGQAQGILGMFNMFSGGAVSGWPSSR
jgi:preprotein translocase subunit SecY